VTARCVGRKADRLPVAVRQRQHHAAERDAIGDAVMQRWRDRMRADELEITLVAPTERFDYRPLAVLEAFCGISRWSLALASFAADQEIDLVHDALEAVWPHPASR
jgi:hypothetical protein